MNPQNTQSNATVINHQTAAMDLSKNMSEFGRLLTILGVVGLGLLVYRMI